MSSLLGGDETQTTTSTTTVDLPSWIRRPIQGIVSDVDELMDRPYDPYGGERLAGFTPDEQRAFELTRGLTGQTSLDPSRQIAQEVSRRGLEGFSQEELQPWMDPYIENVLDVGKRRQFDSYQQANQGQRDRMAQTASFGGSRSALGEAQMSQDFQQQLSEYDTLGLSQAYNQGLSGAMQGTQLAGQAGMDMANLAQAQRGINYGDAGALGQIGQQQRMMDQAGFDVDYEEYVREQAYPYEQLQFGSSLLYPVGSMTAGSTNTQVTEQEGGGSFLGTALGLASMAMGIPGVGAAMGGGMGGLMGGLGMGGQMASSIGGMMGGFGGGSAGANFYQNAGLAANQGMMGPYSPFNPSQGRRGYARGGEIKGYEHGGEVYLPMDQDMGGQPREVYMAQLEQGKHLSELEEKYDLPSGFMMNMYEAESSYGQNMESKAGAQGHFQFMPETAKERGLKDPFDFNESATAAASYISDLREQFDGDLEKATAAYNWGSGNVRRKGIEAAPKETQEYLKKLLSNGYAEGGLVKSIMNYQAPNPLRMFMSQEDIDKRKDLDPIKALAGTGPVKAGNALAEWAIQNPAEAAGWGLTAVPVLGGIAKGGGALMKGSGALGKAGKGALGLAKKHPQAAAGLAGLGLLGATSDSTMGDQQAQHQAEAELLQAHFAQKEAQEQQDAVQKAMAQAAKVTGKGGSKSGGLPTTQQQRKEPQGLNMPLIKFGASLLQSDQGFFKALGEGAEAFVTTKTDQQALALKNQQNASKLALDQLRARAYAQQVNQSAPGPWQREKERLQVEKLQRDVAGTRDLEKARQTMAKTILENRGGISPAEAWEEAGRIVMSQAVGNTQPTQAVDAATWYGSN